MTAIQIDNMDNFDWELLRFPFELTDITLKYGYYRLRSDSKIKIWRNSDFKLNGTISGFFYDKKDLEYLGGNIEKGSFIKGEVIECKLDSILLIQLRECLIHKPKCRIGRNVKEGFFEADLSLDSIVITQNTSKTSSIIIDWHICSLKNLNLPRFTTRLPKLFPFKFREDFEEVPKVNAGVNSEYIHSRDYLNLWLGEYQVIIQKTPIKLLPDWASGIAIEYNDRNKKPPNTETRKAVSEFVSFIFGSHLLNIGSTHFDENKNILGSFSYSPWGYDVKSKCNNLPLPPIDNGSLINETIISNLLKQYMDKHLNYDFSDILWKLWIGKEQYLGTNLPILSSGLESLVDRHIELKGLVKKYKKSEKTRYRKMVKSDIESVSSKIKEYPFLKFIVDKLNNPFSYSIREKMNLFLEDLGIVLDDESIESKAIRARNKMAHSSNSNFNDVEIIKLKRLSNAYITFYHRIILRILEYDGGYVDYYSYGYPIRLMGENINSE